MPLFRRRTPAPDRAPDLAGLRRECREFIAQLELTEANEDWIPTAIYYGKDGPGVTAFNLDPANITQALEEWLEEKDVAAWGFWRTTWMVLADEVDPAPEARPAEHPRRFEALLLSVHAAGKSAIELARIERHEDAPPSLGEWEILDEGEPLR